MSEYYIDEQYLTNESDVEQKVVLSLLSKPEPLGLGFNNFHIQSKLNLRKLEIEKRQKARLYYPDYVILIDGLPLMVVEVKNNSDDLEEGYREARMYAHEINSLFPENLNPCRLVIAIHGRRLLAGSWDSMPLIDVDVNDWVMSNAGFSELVDNFGSSKLIKLSKNLKETLKTSAIYRRPINLLGGKDIQNQQIKNTFGETISIQYRHLFNPTEEAEREDIVRNAYVKVDKHLSHVDPIDKLIRKKISPSAIEANEIEDNTTPKEITLKLNNAREYNNQLLLLIGSVGSGKTTFMSYLKEIALDDAVSKSLAWIRLDLNAAPVNNIEIYTWLKNNICENIINSQSTIDLDDPDIIKEVYKDNFIAFDKMAGKLLKKDSDTYNEKLFEQIIKWRGDIDLTLESYIKYFIHNKGKELIIVLDNCDKRNLEEQLLMFEVATWLKDSIKTIVFLPLRETTFDHYRNQKPLDTVVKDLIFRINPPPLEKVIYSRIRYADRLSDKDKAGNYYTLPNGFRVHYPSTDEIFYLKSILKSLFQNNFFKKLITGLAGRDIRKGMEIFLDFCKSGHIPEMEIVKMKHNEGNYEISNHIISRVLLRGNKMYYNDANARIKNLFYSDPGDDLPNPFLRINILEWLSSRNRIKGPSGITGFWQVNDVIKDLVKLGHNADRLLADLRYMTKYGLIISESQKEDSLNYEELISINSTGFIHLELLNNMDYLSACSEDVWYSKETIAIEIAKRISNKTKDHHFSISTTLENSKDLIGYLKDVNNNFFVVQQEFLSEDAYKPPLDFENIEAKLKSFSEFKGYTSESNLPKYAKGDEVVGKIVKITAYGLICNLDNKKISGFIHISDIENENFYDDNIYHIGQEVQVIIKQYKPDHKRYNIKFK
ncbi:S1 RNA-binding domain-containing protein [Flavobacterium sp. DGU11]|uniref:S1 RNA-binding domain-containing protein n=1 Tax=Flavobacterium arundinis TaxID=3139143 RepID=A0ABU9HYM9_9FLAO